MPDFKKMTVERLRELARKVLGPGHTRLKTKGELVRALEEAGEARASASASARPAGTRARPAGSRAATATGKAVRVAKEAGGVAREGAEALLRAGKAAREGVRAMARAGKAAAGAAAEAAAEGARAGTKAARERQAAAKPSKAKAVEKVERVAAAAAGAATGIAAAARGARARSGEGMPDPEGYFVARVRGEDAVREAPHPLAETGGDAPYQSWAEGVGAPTYEESLGELPWGYGDDAFVALPRDPRTLFFYWDHSGDTLSRGFAGLADARAQLWVFAQGPLGWERIRSVDFALESRGFYVHDLEPGRAYRGEIHAVDREGRDRLLGAPSNEVKLPPVGPSPIVDDRFVRLPWDVPLGALLGPGHPGGPFSDEARAMLARLSDWTRFSGSTLGGSAGGMGGRPSSPTSAPSSSVPSSPRGPWGEGDER